MFSKTCEYAIRALIYIAQNTKDGSRVNIKEIAQGIDSPVYFIAKILQDLSRKGFVMSVKGLNGGFYMSEKNLKISIADVVKEIDGDKLFVACSLGLKECSEDHPCPLHNEYKHIKERVKCMLENNKLALFAEDPNLKATFLRK